MGVETGGCPHTAIREDASMNLAAIEDMNRKFPRAELCFVESGGDNLAATFSPELADLTIYVIDVAEGEKIPRMEPKPISVGIVAPKGQLSPAAEKFWQCAKEAASKKQEFVSLKSH